MIEAGPVEWASFLAPLLGVLAADRLSARPGTAPGLRRAALVRLCRSCGHVGC